MEEAYDGPGGYPPQAPPSGEYPSQLAAPPPQGQPPVYLPQTPAPSPPAKAPQQSEMGVSYVKSPKGVMKIVQIAFLVIAIACAASWDEPPIKARELVVLLPSKEHWNEWIFFIVVTSIALAFALMTLLLYVFRVVEHGPRRLWITSIQTCYIVLVVLLLACSAMLAEEVRTWNKVKESMEKRHGEDFFPKLEAAMVFGFLSMVAFAVDVIIHCERKDWS